MTLVRKSRAEIKSNFNQTLKIFKPMGGRPSRRKFQSRIIREASWDSKNRSQWIEGRQYRWAHPINRGIVCFQNRVCCAYVQTFPSIWIVGLHNSLNLLLTVIEIYKKKCPTILFGTTKSCRITGVTESLMTDVFSSSSLSFYHQIVLDSCC